MADNIKEKIEDKIIDWVIRGSGNRLVVFKPEKPAGGIDLVIEKKGDYETGPDKNPADNLVIRAQTFGKPQRKKAKEISISVNGQVGAGGNNIFVKDINIEEFALNKNFYFIFAFFDILRQDISDNVCFISLEEFKKNAGGTQDKNILKFESYLSPNKKDKYSEFLINKKDLSQVLFRITSS
jgi:hypothetical protein